MRVKSPDGTEIACETTGHGPPLVLVHGTGGSAARWRRISAPLAERFTVHAMDRRGRGASGDSTDYDIEREFEDLAAVVDAASEAAAEPVRLLGHSFGGLCALEASLRTTDLRSLVLYEPAVPIGIPTEYRAVVSHLSELLGSDGPEKLLIAFLAEVVQMPAHEVELMREQPEWKDRVAAAHTIPRELEGQLGYTFHPEGFEHMGLRTMVMMGSESPPFLTHAARTVRMALPHGILTVLDGQKHVAMDTAPDLFVRTLVDFLT